MKHTFATKVAGFLCASLLVFTSGITAEEQPAEKVPEARTLFAKVNKARKGPFGLNVLQGKFNRTTVKSGRMPKGELVFQAALRNEEAELLASHYGLYTGNLFSPNLFELFGDFVYMDRSVHHDMPMDKLDAMTEGAEPVRFPATLQDKNGVEILVECSATRFTPRGRTLALILARPI